MSFDLQNATSYAHWVSSEKNYFVQPTWNCTIQVVSQFGQFSSAFFAVDVAIRIKNDATLLLLCMSLRLSSRFVSRDRLDLTFNTSSTSQPAS